MARTDSEWQELLTDLSDENSDLLRQLKMIVEEDAFEKQLLMEREKELTIFGKKTLAENKKQRQEITELIAYKERLKEEMVNIKLQLIRDKKRQIAEAKDANEKLKEELEKYRNSFIEEGKNKLKIEKFYRAEISNHQKQISELMVDKETSKKMKENLEKDRSDLLEKVKEIEQRFKSETMKLELEKNYKGNLEKREKAIQLNYDTVKRTNEANIQEISKLKLTKQKLEEKCVKLDDENKSLAHRNKDLANSFNTAQQELKKDFENVSKFAEQVKQLETDNKRLKNELTAAESKITSIDKRQENSRASASKFRNPLFLLSKPNNVDSDNFDSSEESDSKYSGKMENISGIIQTDSGFRSTGSELPVPGLLPSDTIRQQSATSSEETPPPSPKKRRKKTTTKTTTKDTSSESGACSSSASSGEIDDKVFDGKQVQKPPLSDDIEDCIIISD